MKVISVESMADSDDDFERRQRDKFRGERSDYGVGGGGVRDRRVDNRRREEWSERGRDSWGSRDRGGSRRDYGRDYGRSRDRYSPIRHDMSPPMKRMRPDHWDERRYGFESSYGHYGNYPQDFPHQASYGGSHGPGPTPMPGGGSGRMDEMGPTQPPMMSFKTFVERCEDGVSEEDAMKKYSEYKLEFKRNQLNDFFSNHKEEEWFKNKYHPEESVKRKEEQIENLKRRVQMFLELEESKRMGNITVDADQSDQLLKLLDSVVIKLEGGTDFDLQVLDQPSEDEVKTLGILTTLDENKGKTFVLNDSDGEEKKDEEVGDPAELDVHQKAKKYLTQKTVENAEPTRKRKRATSGSSSSDSESEGEEPAVPGLEEKKSEDAGEVEEEEPLPPGMDSSKPENGTEEAPPPPAPAPPTEAKEQNGVEEKGEVELVSVEEKEPEKEKKDEEGEEEGEATKIDDDEEGERENPDEDDAGDKPRPLHKTASIFLRNLAPTITKQEVEAMFRRYSGFLRAAIADPQPERRWFRRGWVAFKRDVNIKDICWNLNNIRLRDCELGAIVNRDLSRRIRTVNGITSHRAVVRSDIKLAAKIIQNLDNRWCLWMKDQTDDEPPQPVSLSESGNPCLCNITDYLIEEASAEEEELLGGTKPDGTNGAAGSNQTAEDKSEGETMQRDPILIKVLDRLLLYLRIVHSVDYYNHSEYPNEDEMPNRCGIMHARGIPPSSKITPKEIQDYCKVFENKIGSFLQPLSKLTPEEAKKLGLKESEKEVEKFVEVNTKELGDSKFQCVLCEKKFKAEEFVHKHVQNKHEEKIKEVEKEVDYFNNYLRDPKRPQLPECPSNKQGHGRKDDMRGDPYTASYPQQPPMYGHNNYGARYPAPGPYGMYGASSYPKDFYNRSPADPYMRDSFRPRPAYRSRVGYRDLDAPKEDY